VKAEIDNKAQAEKAKEDAKKAADAAEKEKAKINELLHLPQTDIGNARRIALVFGDRIRFNIDTEKWGFYNNDVWKFSTSSNSALYPCTLEIADIIKKNIPKLPPKTIKNSDGSTNSNPNYTPKVADREEEKEIVEKLSNKWQQSKTQRAAIELLKGVSDIRISQQDLDNHPYLMNCGNCAVDLTTGKYYEHSPNYYFTQKARANYFPNLRDETVEKFLRDILPDEQTLAAFLDFIGYSITGVPCEEKFLLMTGFGGNGKGTFTSLLMYMLDNYACSFPIEGILYSKYRDANSATPAFNVLVNRRVAIADEIPPNAKIDTAVLKKLTGRDSIYIRRLHQEGEFLENPMHTMIFSGNNLPEIIDAKDIGIIRRLIHVKFEQDFTANPDTTLKSRLFQQSAVDAFFSLIVKCSVEYHKRGKLLESDAIKAATQEYFDSQDFIKEFIAENCEYRADASITRKELEEKLRDAYPDEMKKIGKNTLTGMLEKIGNGTKYKRTDKGYAVIGIGWRV
jgi:putative DNA primase/helicase